MRDTSKNNFISIAKAIGIILMVCGHSGCPNAIGRFIYLFHMPLFFVCSGYFFKEISDTAQLFSFYKKKIKKLYVPYIKWSLLFLFLHNLFYNINIYNDLSNSYKYQLGDYIKQFFKLIVMTDYELLIRPFWFIKVLLLASMLVATISFLRYLYFKKTKFEVILLLTLSLTIVTKSLPSLPIIGDLSTLLLCTTYIYTGILLKKYESNIKFTKSTILTSFIIIVIGSLFFVGAIDCRYITMTSIIPYFILSLFGISLTFGLSKQLEQITNNTILYYIGNNTMPILALNLLALKIGNLLKIGIYSLPIERLSSYTVIYEYNSFFWILNTIIGVTVPLIIYHFHKRLASLA